MKKHIDIKSLLIGIFLASTVLLAIGQTKTEDQLLEDLAKDLTGVRTPRQSPQDRLAALEKPAAGASSTFLNWDGRQNWSVTWRKWNSGLEDWFPAPPVGYEPFTFVTTGRDLLVAFRRPLPQ